VGFRKKIKSSLCQLGTTLFSKLTGEALFYNYDPGVEQPQFKTKKQ